MACFGLFKRLKGKKPSSTDSIRPCTTIPTPPNTARVLPPLAPMKARHHLKEARTTLNAYSKKLIIPDPNLPATNEDPKDWWLNINVATIDLGRGYKRKTILTPPCGDGIPRTYTVSWREQ